MKRLAILLIISMSLGWVNQEAQAKEPLLWTLRDLVAKRQMLAARVVLKKIARNPKLEAREWHWIRDLLFKNRGFGNDLILGWDRWRPASVMSEYGNSEIDKQLAQADALMLAKSFRESFDAYQSVATQLRSQMKVRDANYFNVQFLYPYVIHGMARALFGDKRFAEALEVYNWLTPDYAKFRQVLFEKMWTAFKAGYVDLALGTVASQRSAYLSEYLDPETYLVQIYLFKRLCRDEEFKQVLAEMQVYRKKLTDGKFEWADWASSDMETRILLNLSNQTVKALKLPLKGSTVEEMKAEQQTIATFLKTMYEASKRRTLEQLNLVQAYAQLASTPGMESGLKEIEKMPSRAALFRSGLEVWPAEDTEEWADEVGSHRYMGESLCVQK